MKRTRKIKFKELDVPDTKEIRTRRPIDDNP